MQLFNSAHNHFDIDAYLLRQFLLLHWLMRNEFVERRIDQADSDWKSIHNLKDADEVAPLVRQEFVEGFLSRDRRIGDDHLLDCKLPLDALLRIFKILKKHVFGADQADSLGTHITSFLRIVRRIGVRAYMEFSDGIRPTHQG